LILTAEAEIEQWTAPTDEALKLERPLPDGFLSIVARVDRKDQAPTKVPLDAES
jgi:hypothetical protein